MKTTLPLSLFLFFFSCGAPRVSVRPAGARLALGTRAPRQLHTIKGVELAVHDSDPSGQRPALVCLHAIGHGGGDFSGVEDALVDRFRVITVDWPGHGFSGRDAAPANAARYAELFEALVADLGLTRFVILGNSIGGAAAMSFAAAHPEQVRALVLANPGGLDPGGFIPRLYMEWLVRHFEAGARGDDDFEPWFRDYYDDLLVTPEAAERKRQIVAAGYETAPVLVEAWESFRRPEANLTPLIPRLTMPVLFTWAQRDGLIRWSRNRDAVGRFPNARVEHFDAGHAAFLETPAAFNAALSVFLASLGPSP